MLTPQQIKDINNQVSNPNWDPNGYTMPRTLTPLYPSTPSWRTGISALGTCAVIVIIIYWIRSGVINFRESHPKTEESKESYDKQLSELAEEIKMVSARIDATPEEKSETLRVRTDEQVMLLERQLKILKRKRKILLKSSK